MKILSFMIFFMSVSVLLSEVNTMNFNGTSTTEAGVVFTFSTGNFVNSSDGTTMNLYDNHPYANMINGGDDYKDILISQSIYITSVNVSWAVNIEYFKLQFLNDDIVVKELSAINTGDKTVDVIANKIRFLDEGFSSSGGIELASVSWDNSLPVELTAFSARHEGSDIKLNWQTATEINNFGFEIERQCHVNKFNSLDSQWEAIGFVEGHGNSNSPKTYCFIDFNTREGKVHYRLKQIDNDGSFEYSKILSLNVEGLTNFELLQNYPNPFNASTTIQYNLHIESLVRIEVFDILGQSIKILLNENQFPGKHKVVFDASRIISGNYFYKIDVTGAEEANSFTETKKLILLK